MNSSQTKHKLEVTTPGDRQIAMTRTLDAPRELVFDAFTKPELVKHWLLGPDGWTMPVCEIDLRVGGSYRYRWSNGSMEFGTSGLYREVARPERIVHTEQMEGQPGEAIVTTEFTEKNGTTTVTMTLLHESREIRDMVIETGMAEGVGRSYERLAELLASRT